MNESHVSTDVERAISDLGDLVWPDGWALPLPAKIIDWLLRRGWFDWKSLIGRSVRRRWVGGWVRYQLDGLETARRVLSLNDKEPGTITLLAKELRRGDVFLDVGASVGIYAIPAAGRVGSSGVVVAVEPRDAGDVIVQHARLNGFESRVQRISRPAVSGGQDSIDVMIERGLIRPPSVVKIDVDGPELDVVHGMIRLLRSGRRPRLLSIELNDAQLVPELRQLGYRLREVNLSRTRLERRRHDATDPYLGGNGIFVPMEAPTRE